MNCLSHCAEPPEDLPQPLNSALPVGPLPHADAANKGALKDQLQAMTSGHSLGLELAILGMYLHVPLRGNIFTTLAPFSADNKFAYQCKSRVVVKNTHSEAGLLRFKYLSPGP